MQPGAERREAGGRPAAGAAAGAIALPPMSPGVFARFADLVHAECGIKMPASKKTMLEARLRKRLRALGVADFETYCSLVFGPGGLERELVHLLDVVTTNKTDFFRDPAQFEYLARTALPALTARGRGLRAPLRVWSAGCSSGEEAYTLAMVLEEHRGRTPGFEYRILATDLSTRVLQSAARGVYAEERVAPVPAPLRGRYLLRSRDRSRGLVRVVPELRSRVSFQRLNFSDGDFAPGTGFDVVFCRNVLIYFEKEFQRRLLLRLCACLGPGGYLFLGHTESVHGMGLPVAQVGFSIHRAAG